MEAFKVALVVMALTDTECARRDADGRCRHLSADQLDALADFGWHLPDLRSVLAACANAVGSRRRPWVGNRIELAPPRSGAATSHG